MGLTHPSPNFGERRDGAVPSLIVVHYTATQTAAAACAILRDPAEEVSAHYLIDYDGTVMSLVAEEHRAWHAGAGAWGAITDVNSHSIGIELQNTGFEPFGEPQMVALEGLLAAIMRRWDIAPAGVIGHQDCAPGRKIDPGPRFDWARLNRLGLAARGLTAGTGSG